MAKPKKVLALVKLQIRAGQASRAARGHRPRPARREHHGVLQAVQRRHAADGRAGDPRRAHDLRGPPFSFITKQPPAAELIKQAAGVDKGSGVPNREKVARLSQAQVREIAEKKMADLNANDVENAMRIIEGTARSMGVETDA